MIFLSRIFLKTIFSIGVLLIVSAIATVVINNVLFYWSRTPSPGFVIGNLSGTTASLNSEARFTVALSTKPTSPVTITVHSSDPTEGEVSVSELTFTPQTWGFPRTVRVLGQNDTVVNGVQDYIIVLGPAVSDDVNYSGKQLWNVAMQGTQLSIMKQNYFVRGIPSTVLVPIEYNGYGTVEYRFEPHYPGITYEGRRGSSSGRIHYDGSDSVPEKLRINVSVSDGVVKAQRTIEFYVEALPEEDTILDNKYLITKGQIVRFSLSPGLDKVERSFSDVDFKVNFSGFDHLPDPPADIQPLSSIFEISVADGDFSMSALWPVDYVDSGSNINRATLFRYTTMYGWDPGSNFPESRMINGREWFELGHAVADTPTFIGIDPRQTVPHYLVSNIVLGKTEHSRNPHTHK